MLYVLQGADTFRRDEELRAIRRDLDRDGNLGHNTLRLDRQEVRSLTPGGLRSAVQTASFFAEDRLVILEGLSARLGGGRRRGRTTRSRAADAAPSDADQFIEVLTNLPPTTTVVLLEESVAASFTDGFAGKATVKEFKPLIREQLRSWASERARSQATQFTPAALDRLVQLIDGRHLGELAGEIDKLATYVGRRRIEVEDVDELVSGAIQYEFWDLTDAVIEARTDKALSVLRKMDARDQPPQLLTYMLIRQYRQLIVAQSLLREGLTPAQVGAQMGLRDFPLRKVIEQAGRYPANGLEQAYRRLLESDVAVKTGVYEAHTALELLIVTLTELAKSSRPARTPARGGAPSRR